MRTMHKLSIPTIAIASVLTALSAAHAFGIVQQPVIYAPQNLSRGEVNGQIADVILAGYREGFHVVTDERGQMVDNGRSATFKVYLQAGVQYRFAGRCDSDCADLDMALEDGSGRELIADRDPDDTPSFNYRPSRSGEYTVRLELAACIARRSQVGAIVMAR